MRYFMFSAVLLVIFGLSGQAPAAERFPVCGAYYSALLGRSVPYCYERSHPEAPALSGEPVVYFMHGIGGSARSWVDNGYSEALHVVAHEARGMSAATFVSFDTSGTSFFSDAGGSVSSPSSYETWLTLEFMPFVEQKLDLCRQRKCRLIAGLSMGGLGAIKTALRHPDLFAAVAANSPALPAMNLWEDPSRWIAYFSGKPVGPLKGFGLIAAARTVFTSWDLSDGSDPSYLVTHFGGPAVFPALYWDMGTDDYFGFEDGSERFKKALSDHALPFEEHMIQGGTHELFRERRFDLIRFIRDRLKEDLH